MAEPAPAPAPLDPRQPIPEDRLPLTVQRMVCAALGYQPAAAPPPVVAFASAMRAAVEAMLAAPADKHGNAPGDPLRRALPGAIFAAVANLARAGLLPGVPGTPGTGYLYAQNGVLTGRPSPLGRVRMAHEAGADVETIPVGRHCELTMGADGLVSELQRDPDKVPTTWDQLRGVVVSVTSHDSGLVKLHWVSAGEIAQRKAKSKGNVWTDHPIVMARSKALAIIGDRGGFPQAPIPIPGLREWQAGQAALPQLSAPALPPPPAARALPPPPAPEAAPPAEADAPAPPQPAPEAAQPAPPAEAAPAPAAEDSAPQRAQDGAEQAAPDATAWADVEAAVWAALRGGAVAGTHDDDDIAVAIAGAITQARAAADARGAELTPAAALTPRAVARLADLAVERLRSM